ncbi:MAG: DUF3237 domain-containing protein [Novosphingobium sp.]
MEFLMQSRVLVNPVLHDLGNVGGMGNRKMLQIWGGDFDGPKLKGKIIPGGGDWPLVRPDGVGLVDARYTLETDDGVFINIYNNGYRHAQPEALAELDAKQSVVNPDAYYLRTYTRFEAPLGKYDWLAKHVFIGIGERHPEVLFLRYFMLR